MQGDSEPFVQELTSQQLDGFRGNFKIWSSESGGDDAKDGGEGDGRCGVGSDAEGTGASGWGGGMISRGDFLEVMRSVAKRSGKAFSEEKAGAMFALTDIDKNGFVDFAGVSSR